MDEVYRLPDIDPGADWEGVILTITSGDGQPVNLVMAEIQSQIRQRGQTVRYPVQITKILPDKVWFSLPASITATLTPGKADWDCLVRLNGYTSLPKRGFSIIKDVVTRWQN